MRGPTNQAKFTSILNVMHKGWHMMSIHDVNSSFACPFQAHKQKGLEKVSASGVVNLYWHLLLHGHSIITIS